MSRGSNYSWFCISVVFPLLIKVHASGILRQRASSTIIRTQYGEMRGLLTEFPALNLKDAESYYGIQYASIMTQLLRYMPPTSSPEKWKGTRSLFKHRPVCPQPMIEESDLRRIKPTGEVIRLKRILESVRSDGISEECLNLNLYVPGNRGRLSMVSTSF